MRIRDDFKNMEYIKNETEVLNREFFDFIVTKGHPCVMVAQNVFGMDDVKYINMKS